MFPYRSLCRLLLSSLLSSNLFRRPRLTFFMQQSLRWRQSARDNCRHWDFEKLNLAKAYVAIRGGIYFISQSSTAPYINQWLQLQRTQKLNDKAHSKMKATKDRVPSTNIHYYHQLTTCCCCSNCCWWLYRQKQHSFIMMKMNGSMIQGLTATVFVARIQGLTSAHMVQY